MTAATKQIAVALGISKQAVRKRAAKENWSGEMLAGRMEYFVAALPEPIRVALAAKNAEPLPATPAVASGTARGRQILESDADRAERLRQQKEASLDAFNRLPEPRRREALAKLALLEARDSFVQAAKLPIKRGSELFAAEYQAGNIRLPADVTDYAKRSGRLSVSWRSLFRWGTDYRDQGLVGLVNGYTDAVASDKIDPAKPWLSWTSSVPVHMREYVVGMLTQHPHVKDKRILDGLKARYQKEPAPNAAAVRRFVARFKSANEGLLLYMGNPDAWKNRQMLALGSASEQITALNQLWEMDGTPTDVMLKDGRHCITGCLDVYSRRVKLLVSPTATATAVSALIRRCLLDWGCPPPTRDEKNPFQGIKTDNGKDYVAVHIDTVLDALGIYQPLCPPFSPEKKPHIERFFHTFSHGLLELMPGYIGHNVTDRKAIEARRTFAQRLMKQGGDPVQVEMTGAEFQVLCDRWVNAIYHQDVHSELAMSPADKARSWAEPVRRIQNERALDMLLMPSAGTRVLGKNGLKVGGGHYIAAELGLIDLGTTVRVLEDPTDLGVIYVYREAGDFLCVAQDPERTGIDRAEVASRAKAIQKQIVTEGSKVLRKIAKQTGVDQAFEEILQHRESQIKNVVELPKRSEAYTTDALTEAGLAADARQIQVIDPEKRRAERAALVAEMQETGKLVPLPTSDLDSARFFKGLRRRIEGGETLSEREATWMEAFKKGEMYRSIIEMEADWAAASK